MGVQNEFDRRPNTKKPQFLSQGQPHIIPRTCGFPLVSITPQIARSSSETGKQSFFRPQKTSTLARGVFCENSRTRNYVNEWPVGILYIDGVPLVLAWLLLPIISFADSVA